MTLSKKLPTLKLQTLLLAVAFHFDLVFLKFKIDKLVFKTFTTIYRSHQIFPTESLPALRSIMFSMGLGLVQSAAGLTVSLAFSQRFLEHLFCLFPRSHRTRSLAQIHSMKSIPTWRQCRVDKVAHSKTCCESFHRRKDCIHHRLKLQSFHSN